MTLLKYAPYNTTDELSNGLRLFQDSVARIFSEPNSRPWSPAVDIAEGENDLVLKADIPGLEEKDIDIQLENGTLTIKGERKFEGDKSEAYHRVERSYGAFARSFTLPDSVDPEKVRAEYRNGVLTVTLGKKELAKPRSIRVQVSNN